MHTIKWTESPLSFGNNVCRLCANISDVLVPVYSKDNKEKLEFKIKKCLPIVINKDDEKPKQVCLSCISKLNICNDLVEQCLAAEFKFEGALQSRIAFRKESSPNDILQNRVWDVDASIVQAPKNDMNDCSTHNQDLINSAESITTIMDNPKDSGESIKSEVPATSLTVHAAQLSSDGVIVLGKTDGIRNASVSQVSNSHLENPIQTQTTAHQVTDGDCQDILVMVELKYKDVLVAEHRVEASTSDHISSFTSDVSPNQQDLGTVSIEANASSIPASNNVPTLVPQATVVLEASSFKQVSGTVDETEVNQQANILPKQAESTNDVEQQESQTFHQVPSDKPFSCDICGKSFMRRTNLNAHMGVHTQVKPHGCDLCGKRFVVRWDLTLHKRIHSGLFSCEFCGKAFAVRGKLERHRRIHTGERPYTCDVCPKAFGDKRNLEAHRRCHTGEKPFACKVCGKSFRVNSHLSDHRRVHSQEKPFTCHVCGKSFKWKTNLNIHLKLHSGEHFTCEVCGRDFARKADLQKHFRGHTGDKPFPCDTCDKRFGDRTSLQKHLKSHGEDKPHSCEICGKSFLFIWYLNAHKKSHYEEKPYPCSHCGKIFNKKGNYINHKKWSSDEKSILCDVCENIEEAVEDSK
ncbi:hypothetical protein J437_LFUL011327 [Ladona fulva]|uniref:Uncharacterized protein n=1 Tax=Ladona fulva TaxID=123851 RepID=A0A8K0KAE4_LADFU|nr:hypothetical protein J437_LFUL011327 [Ladona fulva]